MVFEDLLARVLNSFFGDFIENFDRSQLKVGIMGGKYKIQLVVQMIN